ncbi:MULTISPECIES: hypothetical protein [Nocardia]|uniref:hypothetical protein n=1 Tax=Nocardia TaxID=1817 RepID=UPI000FD7B306|nr:MULTISPECIES: hypothetical protein [Nocardia]MBF6188904.1 hypothetical protein [Nocardia farcinica]MBF6294563.1 hypothetical protein [Nocardia farcinica]MBF6314083.1 hypothetical protein [Nocardia farcinica]MBF6382124.1 hypothetical protein [Nocardia farcinica]MBF6387995.1 hypothetical protein [Nocardia farcinica]
MDDAGITSDAEFATARRILTALACHANSHSADDAEWTRRRDDYLRRRTALSPQDRAAVTEVLTVDIVAFHQLPDAQSWLA